MDNGLIFDDRAKRFDQACTVLAWRRARGVLARQTDR